MTNVTNSQDQEQAELSAADEQVLRELTERARTGGLRLDRYTRSGARGGYALSRTTDHREFRQEQSPSTPGS